MEDTENYSLSSSNAATSNAFCNDDEKSYLHDEDSKPTNDAEDFYFESDHPALKDNNDYKKMLEAIFILETQRKQAIKDLDCLQQLQDDALSDPISFVKNLQQRKLQVPAPQKIHKLPVIDWSKYAISSNPSSFGQRQQTRMLAKAPHDLGENEGKGKQNSVHTKPKANQYWTAEEQKKLEELLIEFPPEKYEARRWKKIANRLENRTPAQVASRVQKYFIKLTIAGLPIPGRMPNSSIIKKKLRRKVIRQQPSTFLVSHQPPVYMPDDEDEFFSKPGKAAETYMVPTKEMSDEDNTTLESPITEEHQEIMLIKNILRNREATNSEVDVSNVPQHIIPGQCSKSLVSHHLEATNGNILNSNDISDEEDISLEFRNTKEYQEIMLIKKIIRDREKNSNTAHFGYICIKCKVRPIMGTRWHCTECKTSVDFCSDCANCEYELNQHTSTHQLEAVEQASTPFEKHDYVYSW